MKKDPEMAGKNCPPVSDLSEWFDGEGCEQISRHVEKCRHCKATVDFYKSINQTLRSTSAPPQDLAQRIFAQCREESSPPSVFPFFKHRPFFKVAAILAMIAVVATGINFLGDRDEVTENDKPRRENVDTVTAGDAAAIPTLGETPGSERYRSMATNNPARFVRLVSGKRHAPFASRVALQLNESVPRLLPQSVRHVWVVDDLKQARSQFGESLPEGAASVCEKVRDQSICIRTVLADHEVQQLVDRLNKNNWALISPTLPQPGEVNRLRMIDRQVTYVADIVEK